MFFAEVKKKVVEKPELKDQYQKLASIMRYQSFFLTFLFLLAAVVKFVKPDILPLAESEFNMLLLVTLLVTLFQIYMAYSLRQAIQ